MGLAVEHCICYCLKLILILLSHVSLLNIRSYFAQSLILFPFPPFSAPLPQLLLIICCSMESCFY